MIFYVKEGTSAPKLVYARRAMSYVLNAPVLLSGRIFRILDTIIRQQALQKICIASWVFMLWGVYLNMQTGVRFFRMEIPTTFLHIDLQLFTANH